MTTAANPPNASGVHCTGCGSPVTPEGAVLECDLAWCRPCYDARFSPPLTDADVAEIVRVALWARERAREITSNARALAEEAELPYRRLMAQEGDRLKAWLAGKGQKSALTLEGRLGTRSYPARLTAAQPERLSSDSALYRWAMKCCPEAMTLAVNLDRIPLALCRAADPETGEVLPAPPPGLLLVEERNSLYVESARMRRKEEPDA